MHLIPIGELKAHPLCPVKAFKDMLAVAPTRKANDPLLLGPTRQRITTSWLARKLACVVHMLGISPANAVTLHDFRRAGAETCYKANVDFQNIKSHGTWKSDCFWKYISKVALAENSQIPAAFRATLDEAKVS